MVFRLAPYQAAVYEKLGDLGIQFFAVSKHHECRTPLEFAVDLAGENTIE